MCGFWVKAAFLPLFLLIFIGVACQGAAAEAPEATPSPAPPPLATVVVEPPRPTPTPIPVKLPEVRCIGGVITELPSGDIECRLPTPAPVPTAVPPTLEVEERQPEQDIGNPDDEAAAAPEETPTPAPTPTPQPVPTPRFRVVSPPELVSLPGSSGGSPIFTFSSGPTIQSNILTLSGYITNRPDLVSRRWTIQVWQSDFSQEYATLDCSTEKPVAFLMAPTGSGDSYVPAATPYDFYYCIQGQGWMQTVEVPWLRASTWSMSERKRRYTTEPIIWDFSLRADLTDERVQKLEYKDPEGWTVFIWAGDELIAREWVRRVN